MADPATIAALTEALLDEYKARATYRAVLAAFGPVRPFVNIVEAEERHIAALLRQFKRLGVAPPPDQAAGTVSAPSSIAEACRQGVAAEIENGAMYQRLLETTRDAEARKVMKNLQAASQQRHLPAFRRCAARYR